MEDEEEVRNYLQRAIENSDESDEYSLIHLQNGFYEKVINLIIKYSESHPYCPHCGCKRCNPFGL